MAAVVPLVPAWRVDRSFDYLVVEREIGKVVVGSLVRIPFGGRIVRGVVIGLEERDAPAGLETIAGVVGPAPVMAPPMDRLFEWLAERYVVPRGKAYARAVPPRVRVTSEHFTRTEVVLTPRLARYDGGQHLLDAVRAGGSGTFCVRAVPGEDRPGLIAELVAATPGQAIVAVPEVAYGSLVIDGLTQRFGKIARLDSAVGDAERSRGWFSMAAGAELAAGGRAAVLAPAPGLGLIVVDEEHHQTYKEDRAPRYNAVRVARERAALQSAICVLVSASPSVETGWLAATGAIAAVVPDRTMRRDARPVIELVAKPEDRSLSHELHTRMAAQLRDGGRVALLAPSGMFARAIWCADCRRSVRCPVCEAGLAYGRESRAVKCHRCGYRAPAPATCPTCGGTDLRFLGAGTERLADQIKKSFPRADVVRVDPANPGEHSGTDADIYITTWIGTKPELRPDVGLVGVLDSDWLIRRPDLRSAESAYQALVEMAEWAGPAAAGGRLVIQTSDPGHHSIQAVVRADYDFFLEREVEIRRELFYPPFAELIRLSASGEGAPEALRSVVRQLPPDNMRVLGPVQRQLPQPSAEVLLKCEDAGRVARQLRDILAATERGTAVMVDVDPR